MLEDWGSSKSNEGSRLFCISFDGMPVKELIALPQRSYFISCLYFALQLNKLQSSSSKKVTFGLNKNMTAGESNISVCLYSLL